MRQRSRPNRSASKTALSSSGAPTRIRHQFDASHHIQRATAAHFDMRPANDCLPLLDRVGRLVGWLRPAIWPSGLARVARTGLWPQLATRLATSGRTSY
jgi:hypothetical protein